MFVFTEPTAQKCCLSLPPARNALTKAFRAGGSDKQHFCAVGSVKTNIGHLDAAAGISGLIKTILMLKQRQIPPTLNFSKANPEIDFIHSPFYVNNTLTEWQANSGRRRAGVSSFGIGGSNAHMVLEEAPAQQLVDISLRPGQLILLSAKTENALEKSTENLLNHLKADPEIHLADVAFTLQVGREQFQHRRMLVCGDNRDAIQALETRDTSRIQDGVCRDEKLHVVFMFPGQGAQYINMGRGLYEDESLFRVYFDECCELIKPHIGCDLRDILFPKGEDKEAAAAKINQTVFTQPALFAVEYSLARLYISWGVHPQVMIGHSIGEYVAACLAGVFSLPDALSLVSSRARMMQGIEEGSMLAVPMSADEVQKMLDEGLSVAAINEPSMCVVSGSTARVHELEAELLMQGAECRKLQTSHAFHSEMMDSIIQPFVDLVRSISIGQPRIPYISNLTGTWAIPEDVADPRYWGRHLRNTVQFAAGLDTLFENPNRVFLEIGPGQTLTTLTRRNPAKGSGRVVISSMRHPKNLQSDSSLLLNSLGQLWLAGINVDWPSIYANESRQRVPLPSYPFERERFWFDQRPGPAVARKSATNTNKVADIGHWFYTPGWKSAVAPLLSQDLQARQGTWLVFSDGRGLGEQMVARLRKMGRNVAVVTPGENYACLDSNTYTVQPGHREHMAALFADLRKYESSPNNVLHLWSAAPPEEPDFTPVDSDLAMAKDFYNVLHLSQTLSESKLPDPIELIVVTSGTQSVTGEEVLQTHRAAVFGLCRVIPQELDRIRCRTIDIAVSKDGGYQNQMAEQLFSEICLGAADPMVALRSSGRWEQTFEPVYLGEPNPSHQHLRDRGVYLITGGFGNVGLALAGYLAQAVSARLILVGRSELPPTDSWNEQLSVLGEDSKLRRSILAVRALEEAGAEVLALSADVSDEAQMRVIVDKATGKFGQINGVIHAAAAIEQQSLRPLRDLDRESCELQFTPKVRGLHVLDKVLGGQAPDFCIIMSSIASLLGGLRLGAYASANAYLDTFAHNQSGESGLTWLSVNWDGWHFGDTESSATSAIARLSMTPAQGVDVFARLLSVTTIPQLVVSTSDLQARLEQWAIPLDTVNSASTTQGINSHTNSTRANVKKAVAQDEIEQHLCVIWSELLGADEISVDDNFFDLGGDSLLALQVTSRLRKSLIADLSAATVLESPTVAELTQRVMEQQRSMSNSNNTSRLLDQIKNISPEEKEELLAEARKSRGLDI